jgi:glutamate-1-semialdehyde 2,1-aminomutase
MVRSRDERRGPQRYRSEVAERVLDLTPGAEAAVFGANVFQALRAAFTCARRATGRERVFACRSNPWRSAGQPPSFPFDDLESLERLMDEHDGEVAALVLAPSGPLEPTPGYLPAVRALADRCGAILIFDETLTGFRVHEGGAQALYGVRADLAVFGESLANGMPIGALAGARDLIALAAEPIEGALSTDIASLAAARALLIKIQSEPVIAALRVRGAEIEAEVAALISGAGLDDVVQIVGDPASGRLAFRGRAALDSLGAKSFWIKECLGRRLFSLGAFNVSYAHGEPEVAVLLQACEQAADRLALALRQGPSFQPAPAVRRDAR